MRSSIQLCFRVFYSYYSYHSYYSHTILIIINDEYKESTGPMEDSDTVGSGGAGGGASAPSSAGRSYVDDEDESNADQGIKI